METTLVYGFLEAGKTTYIQDSILHDYFYRYGKTLVLCFESGETEYNREALAEKRTQVVMYEGGEDITAFCVRNIELYKPDRIYIEMNIMMPGLRDQLPPELHITFTTTIFDSKTLPLYMKNLRSHVGEMVKASSMVTFRDCASRDLLAPFSQTFRLMNPKAVYLRQDPMGYHEKAFDQFVPYSLETQEITIGVQEYTAFCLDAGEHPEHYEGKILDFTLPLEIRTDPASGERICGRTVMVCCMADLQFMGRPLAAEETAGEEAAGEKAAGEKAAGEKAGCEEARCEEKLLTGWIFLQAKGRVRADSYGRKWLQLNCLQARRAAQPAEYLL